MIDECLKDWCSSKNALDRATTQELRASFRLGRVLFQAKERIEAKVRNGATFVVQGLQNEHTISAYKPTTEMKREWEVFLRIQGIDPLLARRAMKKYREYQGVFIDDEGGIESDGKKAEEKLGTKSPE